jgi:uncharacterized protein
LLRAAKGPLLVPSPVMGEIGYLFQSRVGPEAEVTFSGHSATTVSGLLNSTIVTSRMAELAETYQDLPLGIVDAAVIAIAERLQLGEAFCGGYS